MPLSESLHYQLSTYAIAAGAAGVSVMALTSPSEAQIIYTPAHEIIGRNGTMLIDFDHDGSTDVTIREIFWSLDTNGLFPGNSLQAKPAARGGIEIGPYDEFAANVKHGVSIGKSSPFHSGFAPVFQVTRFGTYYGGSSWSEDTSNGFLGVRFRISGEDHYGWVRMSIRLYPMKHSIGVLLTGYAYETEPNKPIRAGDTGQNEVDEGPTSQMFSAPATRQQPTLGALALGASGIPPGGARNHDKNKFMVIAADNSARNY